MNISATGNYLRVSQRKMILLADSIKRLSPVKAVSALGFIRKSGSKPLQKLIASAIDNAQKRNLDTNNLKFDGINVFKAPPMKRYREVSRGMAHTYKKRMCHVRVTLVETKPEKKAGIKPEIKPLIKSAEKPAIIKNKNTEKKNSSK